MQIRYDDLYQAYELVSAGIGADLEAAAFLDRDTGEWLIFADGPGPDEDLPTPEDLPDNPRYLAAPTRYELDLGTQLVFDFVGAHLPDAEGEVHAIFRRRGAYGRFKDLLDRRDMLDAWYRFEDARTHAALVAWAEGHGLVVEDAVPPNG